MSRYPGLLTGGRGGGEGCPGGTRWPARRAPPGVEAVGRRAATAVGRGSRVQYAGAGYDGCRPISGGGIRGHCGNSGSDPLMLPQGGTNTLSAQVAPPEGVDKSVPICARMGVEWAIEHRAVFDFLGHPSCLYVVDPGFRAVELICELANKAGDRAALVDLNTMARRAKLRQARPAK